MPQMHRRHFLVATGGAVWTAATSSVAVRAGTVQTGATAAPDLIVDKGFASVVRVAPDVYATVADMSKGTQAVSNGGLIVGRKAVLLIEGHLQPEGAALELETAQNLSKSPIRAAVNTHYHFDHTFGNSYYRSRSVNILAHERVEPLMRTVYAALKGQDTAALLAPHTARVAAASNETDRARAQSDLDAWKLVLSSLEATTLTYPTETIKGGQPFKINLGGITAVLEYQPGHSATDVTVFVPEREIVFTGDLLFNGMYPVAIDSQMLAWRRVVDRLSQFPRRTRFIPGHGPPCGLEAVQSMADVMDDLRRHAEQMMRTGVPLDEAQRRYVIPRRFESFAIFAWGFTVGAAIQKYYTELPKA